jgi:hypothetical protein
LAQLLANLAAQVCFVKFVVFLIKNDQRLPHAAEYVSQGFFLVFTAYTCLLACLLATQISETAKFSAILF